MLKGATGVIWVSVFAQKTKVVTAKTGDSSPTDALTCLQETCCNAISSSNVVGLVLKRDCCDVIMAEMASQITSLTSVYSIIHSGADPRKHQSSASLAFVRGIHGIPVNSPHKWPVTRKMFPFDDVIMGYIFWGQNMTWGYSNISYLLEMKIPLLVHKRFTGSHFNILRSRKSSLQFPDDIFKYFFLAWKYTNFD